MDSSGNKLHVIKVNQLAGDFYPIWSENSITHGFLDKTFYSASLVPFFVQSTSQEVPDIIYVPENMNYWQEQR